MTATPEIAGRVRDAAARGIRLRVRGRGHWMAANRPVRADDTLSVRECTGIVAYVPGDFVMTARAGTPLAEIAGAAGAEGQWLPLDPHGGDDGSIGATVATASGGPLAAAFGAPRDHLLGIEFVTGEGDVVRGGGRVVKNVAGFDLVRLSTGAWGTLGIITEVTFRLRARPAEEETLALVTDEDAPALERLCAGLRALSTMPMACELVNGALAATLELPPAPTLVIRIGGNRELMRAQRDALAALDAGALRPVDDAVWRRLRLAEPEGHAAWRLSHRPSDFAATWRAAGQSLAAAGGRWMHGSVLRGVVRCGAPAGNVDRLTRALALPFDGARIGETLPASIWKSLPPAASDRLSHGVRAKFDPRGILNPGILGETA